MHLFLGSEYAQFWVFNDMSSLMTCRCRSISFCTVLCVVSALNSWAIRSEACISTGKYKCLPFFCEPCGNYFEITFIENEVKRKRIGRESAEVALYLLKSVVMVLQG